MLNSQVFLVISISCLFELLLIGRVIRPVILFCRLGDKGSRGESPGGGAMGAKPPLKKFGKLGHF